MATSYTDYSTVPPNIVPATRKFSWSGIFSGAFLFLGIEVTFGLLGLAIFASVVNPAAAPPPYTSLGIGPALWMVILSIIALYFAGRLASSQSAAPNRNSGMYSGLVTFGMCVFTTFLIVASVPWMGARASAIAMENFVIGNGYLLFVTFVLGMISAAAGGIHGSVGTIKMRPTLERPVETKRVA